jgi:hypothetical protein
MNNNYDEYLVKHKRDVAWAYSWIKSNLPMVVESIKASGVDMDWELGFNHDASKTTPAEYKAYNDYFYGNNKSYAVVKAYKAAWLHHIHNNPHHWQYWILVNDEDGTEILDMPEQYVVEMICDWWSFSWRTGKLDEIFNWYASHKDGIQLSEKTRRDVESILEMIKNKLSEVSVNE